MRQFVQSHGPDVEIDDAMPQPMPGQRLTDDGGQRLEKTGPAEVTRASCPGFRQLPIDGITLVADAVHRNHLPCTPLRGSPETQLVL